VDSTDLKEEKPDYNLNVSTLFRFTLRNGVDFEHCPKLCLLSGYSMKFLLTYDWSFKRATSFLWIVELPFGAIRSLARKGSECDITWTACFEIMEHFTRKNELLSGTGCML
jgi:hypothetical protein